MAQVSRYSRRVKILLDRIHAEGKEEFDVHHVYNEQEPALLAEQAKSGRTYTGRYHMSQREIGAVLTHQQKALGIESAGSHTVSYSPHRPREEVKLWRFKH